MLTFIKLGTCIDKLNEYEHLTIMHMFLSYCIDHSKEVNPASFKLFVIWVKSRSKPRNPIELTFDFGRITFNKTKSKKLPALLIIALKGK